MPLDQLKLFVNQWYGLILKYELDLLHAYIDDIELQIKKGIKEFEESTPITEFTVELGGIKHTVEHSMLIHKNLDSDSWDLPSIFNDYFPRLQRSSALITIYSFFEHELDSLCVSCQSFYNFKVGRDALKDKGISRSIEYLKLVVELPISMNDSILANVKSIRQIRNLVVHNDGKIAEKEKKKILGIIKQSRFLEIDESDRIVILEGYLQYCLNEFNSVFQHIERLMKDKLVKTPL